MEEERLLILRMISDGKITAEEGAALLDALRDEASTARPVFDSDSDEMKIPHRHEEKHEKDPDFAKRLEEEAGKFAENVQGAAEKFTHLLEERIEKEIKPALANVPSFLSNLPFVGGLFGPLVTIEEEYAGDLPGDSVDIYYSGRNGHLEVKVWDEAGYRLDVQKMIKGAVSEDAKRRKALIVDVEPGRLEAHVKPGNLVGVHTTMWLPREKSYRLHLQTSNGWMRVQEVRGTLLEAHTSNGRIELKNINADRTTARTSNGAIECFGLYGDQLEAVTSNGRISVSSTTPVLRCQTSNGSIKVEAGAGETMDLTDESRYELITSNGSIHIALPEDVVPVVSVDAKTTFGKVKLEPEDLLTKVREESMGDKHIVAQGVNYEGAGKRLKVLAQTNNSSITVSRI